MVTTKGSAGGRTTAVLQRNAALAKYYENPNYCLYCKKRLEVKPGQKVPEVRIKKYCSRSCSGFAHHREGFLAEYNKKRRVFKFKPAPPEKRILSRTKRDVFDQHFRSAHSVIRADARKVFPGPLQCRACGYTTHVEICHVKALKDFPEDASIAEINDPNNLVAFCPTHHWEFDNGVLLLS